MHSMTEGNVYRHIIVFAIPIIIGNIFQQLYNVVDAVMVGRYVGEEAFAAIGIASPIMGTALFIMIGMCIGASVLMAQLFGANDITELKKEISTAFIAGSFFSVIVSIVFIIMTNPVLRLLNTPDNLIHDSRVYLITIFSGLIFTMLYNLFDAAFRSMGNSRIALFFLIIASILHIILDLVFIIIMDMGVFGVGLATVISQAISVLMCAVYGINTYPVLRFKKEEIIIDKNLLKKTAEFGWIAALQQSCVYIGRMLVQSAVNPLGISAIAAFSAVSRIDAFILSPGEGAANAITTFIAQNEGAGKKDRTRNGLRAGALLILVYCFSISLLVYFGAYPLMGLFVEKAGMSVILEGVRYLHIMSLFYVLSGLGNAFQGFFRGIGKVGITFFATFIQIIVRVVLSYILAPGIGLAGIALAVGIGWMTLPFYQGIMYYRYLKKSNLLIK
ncbi:MAG: MATE family efflux transporter [Clostridiaceae bacterium]|nr:MATE family efflux transporter [Clostridiaceae bacterium]